MKVKGVFKRKSGRWSAVINRNGEKRTLGTFETEAEANRARLEAEANIHCIPTYTEKMKMARSQYDETMAEINDSNLYKDKIKNFCFRCQKIFENSWHHYKSYGNFCQRCSGEINFKMKEEYYNKRFKVKSEEKK